MMGTRSQASLHGGKSEPKAPTRADLASVKQDRTNTEAEVRGAKYGVQPALTCIERLPLRLSGEKESEN